MLTLDRRFDFRGRPVAWGMIGEGDPIVLIHGTPFSSQVWRRIAPHLAQRHRVYFFDLLGYGQSDMTAGRDVSLGVQNELLAALFLHWGLDRPDVLCHDFGGATALRAYYLNGLRYRRMTIFDAVAVSPWGSPFVQHVRDHEAAFAGAPAYIHDALLRAYLRGAAYRPLSEEALGVYSAPWTGQSGQAAFYRQIAQMKLAYTDEVEDSYGPMEGDVRVLWGTADDWIPLSRGKKLADKIAGGRLTAIPNAGHLVQDDAPEAIVAAVLNG